MKFYCTFLVLLLTICFSCDNRKSSKVNCTKWHTGLYEIVDGQRNILIERDRNTQTETDRNTSSYTKFVINWIDNCTYQLKFLEGEEGVFQVWKDNYMEVVITGPTAKGYSYRARFSNSTNSEEGEAVAVR